MTATIGSAPVPRRRRSRHGTGYWVRTVVAWLITLVVVSPLALMVLNVFKTEGDAAAVPPKLIFTPTLDTLTHALQSGYLVALTNSVIIVGISTVLCVVLGVTAAFALAFQKHRGDRNIVFWMLSTTFMPAVGVILPIYLVFTALGLLDTHFGLILLYTAMNLPIVVLIMRSFYLDIPEEVIEAARIDGAGTLRLFWSVVVPVSAPGVATAALLSVIFAWNEFFFAIMLTSTQAATLPVFIASSQTTQGISLAGVSAASTLAVLPLVILGWVAQRRLAEGFTLGTVK